MDRYDIFSEKYNVKGLISNFGVVVGVSFKYDKELYSKNLDVKILEYDVEEIKAIGLAVMEEYLEKIIKGEVKARKVLLQNWSMEKMETENGPIIKIKGNVTGDVRWKDNEFIEELVESSKINIDSKEVIVYTENQKFYCPINSCFGDLYLKISDEEQKNGEEV